MIEYHKKQCSSERKFRNELFVYQSSFPYKPKLIEIIQPRTFVLEKVDAISYLDLPELTVTMLRKLADTIFRFHSVARFEDKVLCHWDNQPQNILWSEKRQSFYLIDFEDIRFAAPEADLAHLLLFWAEIFDYDTFKHHAFTFLTSYQRKNKLSVNNWESALTKAKMRFTRRRNTYHKQEAHSSPERQQNIDYLSSGEFNSVLRAP
ncbi:MAG TPA: phosphotransferase [Candidatus Cloacimonadota bacterium]|nr:phosphotransferase [Candidatus Cloacimonadota bacterium]